MAQRDKQGLVERTRKRNAAVRTSLMDDTPLASLETQLDSLSRPTIENYMAISDETYLIKEDQRDRAIEQSQTEIAQERDLALAKAKTERRCLAIKMAANEYTYAAQLYDAQVKDLIMLAKEYAAEVEREQAALERSRATLAVALEENKLKEINAKIFYEAVDRGQVEADIARAKVDVAKARVRAVAADIEARKAEVDVIEAKVQGAIAVADKATLQADVAMIFAECITKQLSEIKLAVDKAEIAAGFEFIQTKMDDLLGIWDERNRIEQIREQGQTEILAALLNLLADEKAEEDLRVKEATTQAELVDYEKEQAADQNKGLRSMAEAVTSDKETARTQEYYNRGEILKKKNWASQLVNAAHAYVNSHHTVHRMDTLISSEYISK